MSRRIIAAFVVGLILFVVDNACTRFKPCTQDAECPANSYCDVGRGLCFRYPNDGGTDKDGGGLDAATDSGLSDAGIADSGADAGETPDAAVDAGPGWHDAGFLFASRVSHVAVRLQDGKVLVIGGSGLGGDLASVEVSACIDGRGARTI